MVKGSGLCVCDCPRPDIRVKLVGSKTGLAGTGEGLFAVGYLELVEDIGDIIGYRLRAQREQPGDLDVGGRPDKDLVCSRASLPLANRRPDVMAES